MSEFQTRDLVLFDPPKVTFHPSDSRHFGVVIGQEHEIAAFIGWWWVWFAKKGKVQEEIALVPTEDIKRLGSLEDAGYKISEKKFRKGFDKELTARRKEFL